MSVSILEALHNAEVNFTNARRGFTALFPLAFSQLHNATTLLDKGYSIHDEMEPLMDKYGAVENVPDKEELRGEGRAGL